ncbi:hypothetical protein D9615_006433 [Tricholomella constricta]|uniref:Potassium transporter n=1 Tax=Tricholomella constricta TaxID=117010 RepID=A0A8H5H5N2_9AGAR|nr:hypothetical protein D9615_006433 [Tricholomella constricta]
MEATFDYDAHKLNYLSQQAPTFKGRLGEAWNWVYEQSTFFRLHLSAFTLIPLITSGIFYACNGRYHIPYIDCLFLCYSAMTGTGLATRNLSTLTPFQQVLLWLLMASGTTTTTSWLMVLARRKFLRSECDYIYWIQKEFQEFQQTQQGIQKTDISMPHAGRRLSLLVTEPTPGGTPYPSRGVTPDVINGDPEKAQPADEHQFLDGNVLSSSPSALSIDLPPISPIQNITWQDPVSPLTDSIRQRRVLGFHEPSEPSTRRGMTIMTSTNGPFPSHVPGVDNKHQGLGGFPGPVQLVQKAAKHFVPKAYNKFERSMTLQTTTTVQVDGRTIRSGRNSYFRTETMRDDEVEKIGGAEYRALNLLSFLIPIYFVAIQLITFLVFAPWLAATKTYNHVFETQPRSVSKLWFSLFLTMSAYSGTGLDLCDTAMLPFQEAYLMIFGIMFALLAGNHAQPIFLRFVIWITKRFSDETTNWGKTLKFLLDHPRRHVMSPHPAVPECSNVVLTYRSVLLECNRVVSFWDPQFVYFLNSPVDLGLPIFKELPIAPRVIIGLFQGIAVRASGLTIIVIGNLAPAVQFLYVVMMYIAVYPVGMCIRATNVYEERSLGIFEDPEGDIPENLATLDVRERVGRYLGWHVRQQMAIDIWWLVSGIFIVTIIERGNIMNPEKPYIALFPIIFELVSAFAGIGLSLGFPGDNFSLVGTMGPLSKIVVIIIMIRGRHRGLPVAIDRAVMFPEELVTNPKKKSTINVTTKDGPTTG